MSGCSCFLWTRTFEFWGVCVDYYNNSKKICSRFPTSLVTRSKACVCSRSLSGTVVSNPAVVTGVLSLVGVFVIKQKFMRRADHSSREVLPSVVPPMSATARHRKGGGGGWNDPETEGSFTKKIIYSIRYWVYLLILHLFMQKKKVLETLGLMSSGMWLDVFGLNI